MRIALTGNPNSGKTTMYNALTGRNEKVGNWAGVTVEKKEHPIKKAYYGGEEQLIAVDLPGAYSMSPFTSEESITSAYVKHENPDVIINIVDATNLSRSLFFTTQLLELGIPVVVALNKSDINAKKQTTIDDAFVRSKDPNTQVGACIVSPEHKILSMGYNGFPLGCSDDEFTWSREGEDNKYYYSTHSELNAILNYRGGSLEGATIYVTLFPCNECAKAIIQTGIREVVYDSDKYEHTQSVIASKKMLKAAGVTLRRYEHTDRMIHLKL